MPCRPGRHPTDISLRAARVPAAQLAGRGARLVAADLGCGQAVPGCVVVATIWAARSRTLMFSRWEARRGSPRAAGSIGHEFIGVVEETGAVVSAVARGDLVLAPFIYSDVSCPHCQRGSMISCGRGGSFGDGNDRRRAG